MPAQNELREGEGMLRVGDSVTWSHGGFSWVILAIHQKTAWVGHRARETHWNYNILPLSELRRPE